MSLTRPPSSTPEDLAKWVRENHGATIKIQDPRLSGLTALCAVVITGCLTSAIIWGVSAIVENNKQTAVLIEQMKWINERLERLERKQQL